MVRRLNIEEKAASLRAFIREHRRVPGYAEMLRLFSCRSKNTVHHLLEQMVAAGYLEKAGRKIAPTPRLLGGVRLLGSVQAGFPSPAEEEMTDLLSLDEFLVKKPSASFLLTVSGDSMTDAGIYPGDLLVVERGATPKNRDIVVAQVDDEWTLKYFLRDRNGVVLEAANRKYPPIRPQRSLVIGGVVRAVIRKYE